jgi:hypothetical protein
MPENPLKSKTQLKDFNPKIKRYLVEICIKFLNPKSFLITRFDHKRSFCAKKLLVLGKKRQKNIKT